MISLRDGPEPSRQPIHGYWNETIGFEFKHNMKQILQSLKDGATQLAEYRTGLVYEEVAGQRVVPDTPPTIVEETYAF